LVGLDRIVKWFFTIEVGRCVMLSSFKYIYFSRFFYDRIGIKSVYLFFDKFLIVLWTDYIEKYLLFMSDVFKTDEILSENLFYNLVRVDTFE